MEQDFLLDVLLEHIASASIIPFLSSITLEAMVLFGGYDLTWPAFAAIAGALVGCTFNWGLGRIFAIARDHVAWLQHEDIKVAGRLMQRYGFVLAAFYWVPLGAIIPLLCGFFRCNLLKVLVAVIAGAVYTMSDYLAL